MDTKNSDIGICKPDLACNVVQVSKTSSSFIPVKDNTSPLTVVVDNALLPSLTESQNQDYISLFPQPNTAKSLYLIDVKTNEGSVESTYSNTAIPIHIWHQHLS